jgi:O-antigen/teichoic acid export membrane protein
VGIKGMAVILSFFIFRMLNQNVNSNDLAQYNIALSYLTFILAILNLGIPQLIQKYFTNYHNEEKTKFEYWTFFSVVRFFTFILGILLVAGIFFIVNKNFIILALGLFISQFILLTDINFRAVTDAVNESWKFALTDFGSKVLLLSSLFVFSNLYPSISFLNLFVILSILIYTFILAIDFWWHRNKTKLVQINFFKLLRENWKKMFAVGFSSILIVMITNLDRPMLFWFGFKSEEIVGYANAFKFYEIGMIAPGLVLAPVSSILKKKLNETNEKLKILKKYLGIITVMIFSYFLIVLFGGYFFLPFLNNDAVITSLSQINFIILSILLFTSPIGVFISSLFILYNKEKYELFLQIYNSFVLGIAFYFLIKGYGSIGASISLISISLVDLCLRTIMLFRLIKKIDK